MGSKGHISRRLIAAVLGGIILVIGVIGWSLNKGEGTLELSYDLNQNGINEKYVLNKGRLTICEEQNLIWQSPAEWKIEKFLWADADNDGQQELLMVLWKKGSFGPSKPLWGEGPDDEYSNHLFMYLVLEDRVKPVWCSSALDRPIVELEVKDVNQDGKNELQVLEGPEYGPAYALRLVFSHSPSCWVWQGWGFVRV